MTQRSIGDFACAIAIEKAQYLAPKNGAEVKESSVQGTAKADFVETISQATKSQGRSRLTSLQSRLHECWVRTVASASTLWTVRHGQGASGSARHAKSGGLIVQWVPFPRLFSHSEIGYPGFDDVACKHDRMILRDS